MVCQEKQEILQVRVSESQKSFYEASAKKARMSLSTWVRNTLDKAVPVTDLLRVSPEDLAKHQARQLPRDDEGWRLMNEEITREILDDEAAREEGVLDEEADAIYAAEIAEEELGDEEGDAIYAEEIAREEGLI